MKRNNLLNPGPATTTDTVKQALMVPDICPREEEFGELTKSVLKKIVDVVNGQSTHSTVIFAGSGTAGVESALCSVVPVDGKILILDNGAYGKRAETIIQAYGISHRTIRIEWGDFPDISQIENVRKKNNKNWMDLLRVSFRYNPTLSKKIVRQIFNDDRRINKLVKKLIK